MATDTDADGPDSGSDPEPDDVPATATIEVGGVPSQTRTLPELTVGEQVGRYVLLRPIAVGGMGVVYVAFDPELDRNVALKLLLPRRSKGGDDQARLVREAQALARLSHPNVVQVYDVGTLGERVYVAMEYVDGQTLSEWLAGERRPWRTILEVMLKAGQGLVAAHQAGLVHLDFKPSNVLVGTDDVRVLDFGLAREAGTSSDFESIDPDEQRLLRESTGPGGMPSRSKLSDRLTRQGVVMGTPGYIAPEQYESGTADARADQFGFCVTFWEALYAQRPFAGATRKEIRQAVLAGEPRSPPTDRGVPSWLRRVLLRGLERRPGDRYPDTRALLDALQRDPSRRLRKLTMAVAVVMGVGLSAYGYQQALVTKRQQCQGAAEALAGVWDDQRRETIQAAFLATEAPFAQSAWQSVASIVDEYTGAWIDMHTDACEATRLRGEQSEDLMDRRIYCLNQRLAEVDALGELFADADPGLVENAVDAAQGLSDVSSCGEQEVLAGLTWIPADPVLRAASDSLGRQLGMAKGMRDAGRYQQGEAVARQAIAEAQALELWGRVAHGHLILGVMLGHMGRIDEARKTLHDALWLADRSGADGVRVELSLQLAWLVGHVEGNHDLGHWYAKNGMAVATRLGDPPEQVSRLLSNEAVLFTLEGRYDEAIANAERSLALRRQLDLENDPQVAASYNNMASAMFAKGEYEQALTLYERAHQQRREILGDHHPEVAEVLGNIGNVYEALGEPAKALKNHQESLRIQQHTRGATHPGIPTVLNNIGVVLQQLERHQEAYEHFTRAHDAWASVAKDHPMVGVARVNQAESLDLLGRPGDAVPLYQNGAAVIATTLGPEHPYVGHALSGQGRAQLELGRPNEAAEALERAVAIFEAAQGASPVAVAEARFGLARALRATDRDVARAARLAEQARAHFAADPRRNAKALAAVESWLRSAPRPETKPNPEPSERPNGEPDP